MTDYYPNPFNQKFKPAPDPSKGQEVYGYIECKKCGFDNEKGRYYRSLRLLVIDCVNCEELVRYEGMDIE